MSKLTKLSVLALTAVFSMGCGDGSVAAPDEAALVTGVGVPPPAAAMSGGAHHSVSDIFDFAGPQVEGWSKVTRNWTGATMTLHTSELIPGNAYTMWVVIFNNPGACTAPCDDDDVAPGTAAEVDVVFVAGHVLGGSGKATFSGRRAAGDNSKSLFAQFGAPAPGLTDPHGAELHLIVRDHGPKIPGQVPDQIQTFEGACTAASSFGLGNGPNTCADVQFSVHLP